MEITEIKSVDQLQELSQERKFEISEINWAKEVNHKMMWLPESVNPIFYLPSYHLLSAEEKLKINQYYALGLCEKFTFLEEAQVCALETLAGQNRIPFHLKKIAQTFVEEEVKHSEMFTDLCNKALPSHYQGQRYYFFKRSDARKNLEDWLFSHPHQFIFWSWLAAYFEEKTIIVSKEYLKAKKSVDPLFVQVHAFHLRDELRHVEIDKHFFDYFYKDKPKYKKVIAKHMFVSALKKIIIPRRTLGKIVEQTTKDLQIKDTRIYEKIMKEISSVSDNTTYMKMMFGHHNFPVFSRLIGENDEMKSLLKYLI